MHVILACAACYGDPNSPLSKGTFWGVLALIGIIVVVLGGFGSLFVFWMRRAKALERELAKAKASAAVPPATDEPSIDEVPVWREEEGTAPAGSLH